MRILCIRMFRLELQDTQGFSNPAYLRRSVIDGDVRDFSRMNFLAVLDAVVGYPQEIGGIRIQISAWLQLKSSIFGCYCVILITNLTPNNTNQSYLCSGCRFPARSILHLSCDS